MFNTRILSLFFVTLLVFPFQVQADQDETVENLTESQTEQVEVEGECTQGGCVRGEGAMTFPDGGKYVGQFSDERPSGKGTYTCPSGTVYTGEFFAGFRHGTGEERKDRFCFW